VLRATGELVDPHTAVGIRVGRQCRLDPATPLVCLATAHPGKFPDAVRRATGVTPSLPAPLADLHERAERFDVLPNDLCAVQNHIQRAVTAKA
jgi:threonine synthase